MTFADSAPKEGFRLSQLIYDTRYRSYTVQVIVLLILLAVLVWLVNNTIANLAVRGKDINFDFLWSRAGYDIGQTLIPYTNDSTHGRALVIGLLNTLLVAVLASIFATICFRCFLSATPSISRTAEGLMKTLYLAIRLQSPHHCLEKKIGL